MTRFSDLFTHSKPVIAMAHVPPLPGAPLYDAERGVDGLVEAVRADLRVLLEGGVDAVMFCNEGDRPYTFHAGYDGVSMMTRVVTELRPTNIASFLRVADGCIVGSDLKVDGYTWGPVDPARVKRFMEAARS